jgi:hypothetical protein
VIDRATYWGDQGGLLHVQLRQPTPRNERVAAVIDLATGFFYAGDPRHAHAPLGSARALEQWFRGDVRALPAFDAGAVQPWPSAAELAAAVEAEAAPAPAPSAVAQPAPVASARDVIVASWQARTRPAEAEAAAARVAAAKARIASDPEGGHHAVSKAAVEQARHLVGADMDAPVIAAFRATFFAGVPHATARQALSLLLDAYDAERTLGTFASGAGEGIASRRAVCTLSLARAWVCMSIEQREAAEQASAILRAVEREPNGVAEALADEIAAVREEFRRRSERSLRESKQSPPAAG